MKDPAVTAVVQDHPVPQHRYILREVTIYLPGTGAATTCPILVRRAAVWSPEKEAVRVFLTTSSYETSDPSFL